ncbi:hypothetical protein L6164_017095 [Bauhinia variegata]|uniref:Uncharacterized protein n=1 Tax=Bauhinia variegata TaxID=167791 RepID=A0ACB9NBU5_BAUVA|nr:hypothetical protein L6164_017095 [Bauhinia variegata]
MFLHSQSQNMINEHNPPRQLTVNLGSFNVMVDGYCAEGRFKEPMEVTKLEDYEWQQEEFSSTKRETLQGPATMIEQIGKFQWRIDCRIGSLRFRFMPPIQEKW